MISTVMDPGLFLASLGGSGRHFQRLELWAGGTQLTNNAPFLHFSTEEFWVTGQRMSLNLTAEPSRAWERWLQHPYIEVQAYRGVRVGSVIEEVPAGVFPIQHPGYALPTATNQWSAGDRWTFVDADKLMSKSPSYIGEIRTVMAQLINDVGAGAWTQVLATSSAYHPWELWENGDRTELIASRGTSIGAEAFFNRLGTPIVRDRQPFVTGETLRSGEGGTIIDISITPDHPAVVNTLYVSSSNPDTDWGTIEVAITHPDHPAHPNKIKRRVESYSSPLLADPVQGHLAGITILRRKSRLAMKVVIRTVTDPRREVGDLVTAVTALGSYPVIIEKIATDGAVQVLSGVVDVQE